MAAAPATFCETLANVLAYSATDCDVSFTGRLTEPAETIRATAPLCFVDVEGAKAVRTIRLSIIEDERHTTSFDRASCDDVLLTPVCSRERFIREMIDPRNPTSPNPEVAPGARETGADK